MNVQIEMFGKMKRFDWDFYLRSAIENLDTLKMLISEPQTLRYFGYHAIHFSNQFDTIKEAIFYKEDHEIAVSSDDILKFALAQIGCDNSNLYSALLENSIEDVARTEQLNKDKKDVFDREITLSENLQAVIVSEASRIQEVIRKILNEADAQEEALREQQEAEKAALLKGADWQIEEVPIVDEGGKTRKYIHTITIDDDKFVIIERNVFDFGRVLNTSDGGVLMKKAGEWKVDPAGVELSDNFKHAIEIVFKYGTYSHMNIRM